MEFSAEFSLAGEEQNAVKASTFSDAQKAFILKQGADGILLVNICRTAGISQASYFNWKKKYDGLLPTEMRRLKLLKDENVILRKLLADLLDNAGLKDLLGKNGDARRWARSGRASPGQFWDERAAGVRDHRCGPDEHPVSVAAQRRHSVARAVARACPAGSTLWLSAAAEPAAARRRED